MAISGSMIQNSVPSSGPRSVDRAIDVLMALRAPVEADLGGESRDTSNTGAGVSELAARVGLPKSTAHRLLQSLVARGLVESGRDGTYRLGFGLVSLAESARKGDPLLVLASDVLQEVAAQTGETSFLVGQRGGLRVLARVEGGGVLRAVPEIGGAIPWHATASGRLYLAHDPALRAEVRDAFCAPNAPDVLERFTPRTPRSWRSVDRLVDTAGQRGWDINRGEWLGGVTVVAAPVLVGDRIHGTVAIAAPSVRATQAGETRLVRAACNGADLLSARLSGAGR